MPDKIKEVFDLISDKGYFTDEAEFRGYVSDPQRRKDAFELIKEDGYFTDENEFNSYFADETEKKKFKVEDFNKKYGTSYTEQQFGVKKPSQSKSPSTSITTTTTTTPQPKKIEVGESDLKLKEASLREQESLFKSYEPKIAELNAALQPYNELAKANGGALPPEEFAQYQQLYNESRKLSNEYKLAYNGYQQAFKDYKVGIDKYNEGIKVNQKETEAQKAKRLGEEKAKIEKLGKTNPLGRIKLYEQTISNINQKIPYLVEEYNKAEQAGDEAAMQQIELEIDKNQANIDYMTKAIQGQKKLGAMQVEDSLVNSFNVGLYRVIGKSMQAKRDLDESLVRLINDVTGVDQKFTDTYFKHIYKDKSPLSDKFAEAGKYIQKKAEEKGELKNLNRKYGASAWNAMEKGDVPTAIEYAFKDFIGFLPASLMYQNKATAAISSIGIVGDELEAAKERGETPDSKTVLAGGIKAGLEIATERWLGAGKATKQLIDRFGQEGAEQIVREVYEGIAKKSLGRKIAENVGEEVVGENINLLGSNAVDIFINKTKEPDQLFEGIGDNTLVSIFGSGVQSTATTTASHYIDRAKLRSADEKRAKAQQLNEQAIEAESPAVAEAIEEKAVQLSEEADAEIEEQNQIGQNASPEIVEEIEVQNEKLDELEVAMEAAVESDDKDVAEAIGAKIEEVSAYVTTLVEQAKVEGLKKIKEQEDDTKGSVTTSSEGVSVTEPIIKEGEAKSKNEKAKEDSESVSKTREKDIKEVKEVAPAKEQEVVVKEGFTEGKDLNEIFKASKEKYGEKEGSKYNDAANRLVNPNKNTIIEVRSNGVVVKEGEKYLLLPFTNTDANYKKWELSSRPLDVTEQYQIVPLTDKVNNTEVVEPQDQKRSEKSVDNNFIDNNDGTATYNGISVKYTTRRDGTRLYSSITPDNIADLPKNEQTEILSASKELNDIETIKRSQIQLAEQQNKEITFRFSDFPKSRFGEGATSRNYINSVDKIINNGGKLDKNSLEDYNKRKEIFGESKQTNEQVQPIEDKVVTEDSSEDSGKNTKTEAQAVSEKGAEVETKAEKKAKVEKNIDDIAERLKKKFAITTLPKGTKTSGFSQEDLIDLVANVAKEMAKAGIEISEAIKQVIADLKENGDLEGFDEVDIEAKSNEKASVKEEAKKDFTKNTRRHFQTIANNKTLDTIVIKLNEADFECNVRIMEVDMQIAKDYAEKVGIEQALMDFRDNNFSEPMAESQKVALASLLYGALNKGIELSLAEGDNESANLLYRESESLVKAVANYGTEAGRAINAFKNFALDMSNPITATFHAQKLVEKMNQKAKESEANQKNSESVAKDINQKVESGKKKTAQKVVDILDEELYGQITKGSKGLNDSQKKKIKSVFDSFKVNTSGPVQASFIPIKEVIAGIITPKLYNQVIDKVGDLVAEGVSLSVAMTRVSTEFIKNKVASPKEMAAARAALNRQVNGIKEKNPLTDKQKERKAESEKLKEATAEYNAEKEIADYKEKQQKKAESLREKDAKKVLEEVEKLELQRAQQQAKEAADLQAELAKERQRIADLKAKEATDLQDKLAKLELQRAQQKLKDIEKAIKELVSEIPKTNEDLAMELVDEYIKLEANEKVSNETLVNMVKDKLGVNDAQAKTIATEIAKGVKDNIKKKIESKYSRTLNEKKEKEAKTPEQIVNEMVRDSVMGELVGEKILSEYFAKKYGIQDFTLEDAQKVKAISKEIAQANTPERKAEKIAKMKDLLAEKNPVYFADLMDEMWYFAHLSSVLTLVGGTADTNNTYNFMQLWANTLEMPITSILGAIRQGELGNVLNNIMLGFGNAIFQTMEVSDKEKKGMDLFLDIVTKSKGNLLNESFTYLQEAIQDGLSPFQEYEKPFENLRQGEFDINKYFRDAREGDNAAKLKIAKMAASIINSAYRGVPRVLGGSDLFFGSIVKNAYVPIVLREQFYKEGYRGQELKAKVMEAMLTNEIDKENAINKAIKNRESQDITYNVEVRDNKAVFTILDKGKVVTKNRFSKTPMEFETKEDAENYAKENVIPSGTQFKRDVRYYLNEKIGDAAMKTAGKISQRDLLSGKTEASAAQFDRLIGGVARWATEMEQFFGEAAKSKNSVEYKAILKMVREGDYKESATAVADKIIAGSNRALSVISKYISHLVAFRRVAINLARKTSGYTPLGFLRYKRSFSNKGALGGKYAEELTNAERDKILSQALIGTIGLAIMAKAFKEAGIAAFKGDDDEEEDSKKSAIKKYFEKKTGEPMPQKAVDFIYNLREKDIIGSLEFLPRNERQYYNRTGIIKENSIFQGVDKDGNYSYKSILGDPKYASALMIGTYQNYMALADPEDKTTGGGLGYSIYQPISSFFDMSIGQGVGKQFSANKSAKEKLETLAQTMLLDVLEVLNPDIIKKPLQYLDAKLRPNQNLFDFIDREDNVAGGLKEWTINKITPAYGAWYSATQAPQAYGMFGEELYKLPAQGQGALSDAMFNYLYNDKNKEYKSMYDWLGANGFKSLWRAPKEVAVYTQDNTLKQLKIEEIEKYGVQAGQKSFKEISSRMAELQELRLTSGEDAFKREISNIMSNNFKQTYYLGEGVINKEESDKLDEKRRAKNLAKIEKRKLDAESEAIVDKALNVTEKEKAIRDDIKSSYDAIRYTKMFKTKPEQSSFLQRLWIIDAITTDTYLEVKESLGIE